MSPPLNPNSSAKDVVVGPRGVRVLLIDDQAIVGETVRRMLKENGAPPEGKWADIALLEPVRDYKARHASTLLTFDAVVDAIGQIEKAKGSK